MAISGDLCADGEENVNGEGESDHQSSFWLYRRRLGVSRSMPRNLVSAVPRRETNPAKAATSVSLLLSGRPRTRDRYTGQLSAMAKPIVG